MMIVKIGGGAAIDLEAIASDLAGLEPPFVIIHGANALRDRLARRLGSPVKVVTSLSGYDSVFTDEDAMDALIMAYAGLRNKNLVALLRRKGVNALGLCGVDGGLISGRRNAGIRTRQNGKKLLLRDLSGKPEKVNLALLQMLVRAGYTPVLSVPILDERGVPISTENDEIVALLQRELRAEKVVQLIEAPGLLADPARPDSLISRLAPAELGSWETRVAGRMKRKILALRRLYETGDPAVYIGDGRIAAPISAALAGKGTVIQ